MTQDALELYFGKADQAYHKLVEELLADTAANSSLGVSSDLIEARTEYISAAILRGLPLSDLPEKIAELDDVDLSIAMESIPDKEYVISDKAISFTEEDRVAFDEAAAKRPESRMWNHVFSDGRDTLSFSLDNDAQSVTDKVEGYISDWNVQAEKRYQDALAVDAQALEANPDARPKAGKNIEQQQIRLNPDKPSKLDVYNQKKGTWMPGPKMGKFLQSQFEWELYDLTQAANEIQKAPQGNATGRYAALKEMANRAEFDADTIDPDNLRVVISCNPQLVGEMSTGQRWESCMGREGCNYKYVDKDVEAGTVVAYVVHKEDPEARYPLMRQLIKPFVNEDGDSVLVPAHKVYGAEGLNNSRTREALKNVTQHFVQECNEGKHGQFTMDQGLYADGQTQHVSLNDNWSIGAIDSALTAYQDGAIQEWLTEIKINTDHVNHDRLGDHDSDPAQNIVALQKKIGRLYMHEDHNTGLSRMFFREQLQTNVGVIADPKDIVLAIKKSDGVKARSQAFQALKNGRLDKWQDVSKALSEEERHNIMYAVNGVLSLGAKSESALVSAWKSEPQEKLGKYTQAVAPGSIIDKVTAEQLSDEFAAQTGELGDQINSTYNTLTGSSAQSFVKNVAANHLSNLIHKETNVEKRIGQIKKLYDPKNDVENDGLRHVVNVIASEKDPHVCFDLVEDFAVKNHNFEFQNRGYSSQVALKAIGRMQPEKQIEHVERLQKNLGDNSLAYGNHVSSLCETIMEKGDDLNISEVASLSPPKNDADFAVFKGNLSKIEDPALQMTLLEDVVGPLYNDFPCKEQVSALALSYIEKSPPSDSSMQNVGNILCDCKDPEILARGQKVFLDHVEAQDADNRVLGAMGYITELPGQKNEVDRAVEIAVTNIPYMSEDIKGELVPELNNILDDPDRKLSAEDRKALTKVAEKFNQDKVAVKPSRPPPEEHRVAEPVLTS